MMVQSSRKHPTSSSDAAAEMLKTEFRLEVGSKHEQKHRPYVKHELEYWLGGIQEDRRKAKVRLVHTLYCPTRYWYIPSVFSLVLYFTH